MSLDLGAKALPLLEFGSPLFDELWPTIFDVSDRETQNALHLTHSYFRGMWQRADTQRKSNLAKADYARIIVQYPDYPKDCIIPFTPEMWYSWGAHHMDYVTPYDIEKFCAIAGVDYRSARHFLPFPEDEEDPAWVFVSETKDLTFSAIVLVEETAPWNTEVLYFGCTGERERALKLEKSWLEYGVNGRQVRPFKASRWYDSFSDKVY